MTAATVTVRQRIAWHLPLAVVCAWREHQGCRDAGFTRAERRAFRSAFHRGSMVLTATEWSLVGRFYESHRGQDDFTREQAGNARARAANLKGAQS